MLPGQAQPSSRLRFVVQTPTSVITDFLLAWCPLSLLAACSAFHTSNMATNAQSQELRAKGEKKTAAPHPPRYMMRPVTGRKPSLDLEVDFVWLDNVGSTGSAPHPGDSQPLQTPPAVRFKSTIEEIAPGNAPSTRHPLAGSGPLGEPGQVTPDDIRELSKRLRACPLQERRMNIFSYEPVSLPASRVRISSPIRFRSSGRVTSLIRLSLWCLGKLNWDCLSIARL